MINRKRLLETFLGYVRIDSESGREMAMAQTAAADLAAAGCSTAIDDAGDKTGGNGGNVIAVFEGTNSTAPIILSAHLDTVKPGNGVAPVINDGVITSDGTTVLGGDDKSGVASIVEAIRSAQENGVPHRMVEVLFTIGEEAGMKGSKNLDYSSLKAKQAVVFDSSGNVGKIITAAPGQSKIRAEITGKAAHAGIAPETGISAIITAAKAISSMKLLRIDEDTTANIGTLSAIGATNIVSEHIKFEAEARSRSYEKLMAQTDHMVECLRRACGESGAVLECSVDTSYIGYSLSADCAAASQCIKACESIGVPVVIGASGGGSDANVMNANGIEAVVAATGMDKVHTTNERITIENLEKSAELAYALITM